MNALFSYLAALASTALLGLVKATDARVTQAALYRKVQPLLALALTVAAPYLAAHLGVSVDPTQAAAQAPLTTLVAIVAAELLSLLKAKEGGAA